MDFCSQILADHVPLLRPFGGGGFGQQLKLSLLLEASIRAVLADVPSQRSSSLRGSLIDYFVMLIS